MEERGTQIEINLWRRVHPTVGGAHPFQRIGRTYAKGQDDESIFGIVPCLHGMIPLVEHLSQLAAKTDRQNRRGDEDGRSRPHTETLPLSPAQRQSGSPICRVEVAV